jgi:hypothetical protein
MATAESEFDALMTPERLEGVLKAWSTIFQVKIEQSNQRHSTKTAVRDLSNTLGISLPRLDAVMRRDGNR